MYLLQLWMRVQCSGPYISYGCIARHTHDQEFWMRVWVGRRVKIMVEQKGLGGLTYISTSAESWAYALDSRT